MYYEIYVKPDSGPCTVQERGSDGATCWNDMTEAIDVAKLKRKLYPNLHFVVHGLRHSGPRVLIHDTSKG